ncbi:hypothetical protein MN116_007268 [Schistosoma mekongi]|uniref:Tetratricopeptide repeat protein 6 n=1 Tax=Schistosoma mekongi TaxID=38744 RepID=A0AAE1ZAA3_SCHME|nr:hypothetical protein MN116_007268 [Schistosoma mekongi]
MMHSNDEWLFHELNHTTDGKTNYPSKSIEISIPYINIHHRHFNMEFFNDMNISSTQFIWLNQSDIELCIENEMKLMEISNEENNKKIDWIKEVQKIPENIGPVLEFFGSNKHQQTINYKLIINEIERLTYEINRNSSKRSGFDLCRRGTLNRKIGRLQDAKNDLIKSIEIEPKLSSAYWNIHFLFLLEGRIKEALNTLEQSFIYSLLNDTKMEIEMWTQLINCNPTFELAYHKRANLYHKLKVFHYANDDFMKILCLNPKSLSAQFQRGLYKFYSNNWKTAIYDFQEVLSNNPSHFEARYYLARCLLKLSKYNMALAELTACLYFQPIYYKALFTRGCLLTKVCSLQSLRDLTMCICVGNNKYRTMAFVQRGLAFYQLRKYTMAIHDFQSALKNGYFHLPDVYRLLGLTYIQLNLSTRAIQAYTEGIKCQTIPDVKLLLCRAEAYYYSNQYEKAIADAQRVIHLSPHIKEHYLLLGNYLYKLFNTQLAQRCVQHYSSLAEIQNQKQVKQLALAYYYVNKYKEAELILLADKKHQFKLDHILLLALILHKQQRTVDSIELLVNGIKKFSSKKLSEKALLYDHLGQYYMKIGNYSSAIDAFTDFIQIDCECPHVYLNRAKSACQLINSQFQVKSRNLPNNSLIHFNDDNVLNDISKALVLINSSKSPIHQITFNGPIKYVDLIDQCLLTRIMYFGINQRYTKAILNCNEAVHRRPEWTRIWIYCGVFKYILRTYDFSEADFDMAIEKDQRSSLAYYNRGLCRQLCNKWDEAIEDYGQAIKYASLYGSIRLHSLINRSTLYIQKYQNYQEAINDLYQGKIILERMMSSKIGSENEIQSVDYNNCKNKSISELYINLLHTVGIFHQRIEMYTEAENIFRTLTLREPGFLQGHIARANCLMDYGGHNIKMNLDNAKNLWAEALKEYEFAVTLDELSLEASIGLSMCLQVLGRLNDALKQITHSLHIYYDHQESSCDELNNKEGNSSLKHCNRLLADAHDCRAIINLQMGRPQRAIDDLTVSIRLNRHSAKYLINRGVAYLRNHQPMPSIIDFKNAIQLDPTNGLAQYHRALIYLHHGQFEQAEYAINTALNIVQCIPTNDYQLEPMNLDPSTWLLRSIIKLIKQKPNDIHDKILQEALDDIYNAEQLILPKLMHDQTNWPHLHYTKAQVLYELKRYNQAEDEYTKALSLLPSDAFIYEARCKCREKMYHTGLINSYENALTDYRLSLLASNVTI